MGYEKWTFFKISQNCNQSRQVDNGPRTSNLSQQQQKIVGQKWFLNNNIKNLFEKNLGTTKFGEKMWTKIFEKKIEKIVFNFE